MKVFLCIIALVFLSPIAVSAEVSSFVFTSATNLEQTVRQTISVQSQNSLGEKENTTQTTCLEVKTTSPTAKFFGTSSGTDPVSVLVITMNKNSANRNFYYEDSNSGSYYFSLKAAYRPEGESCGGDWSTKGWSPSWNATQQYSIGNNESNEDPPSPSPNEIQTTSSSAETVTFPVEPQVFAEIKLNVKTLIAGAQFFISGEGYGLEKKPLTNARFLWNFGDGTVKSGKSVSHTYRNPGDYLIVLDVSSEKFAGTARQSVSVIKSPLSISITKEEGRKLAKIINNDYFELDLSGWFIESNQNRFIIPLHTVLLPKKYLIFDSEVLLFEMGNDISLLYPTGAVAHKNLGQQAVIASVEVSKSAVQSPVQLVSSIKSQEVVQEEGNIQNVASVVVASEDGQGNSELQKEEFDSGVGWIFAFIILLGIATGSVFLIKRPVYNQADEFTIEER